MTWRTAILSMLSFGMLVAFVVLWLRVRTLESTVDELTAHLQSPPRIVPTATIDPRRAKVPYERPIFKLIDGATASGEGTSAGIPWSVEKAMMGDALRANQYHNQFNQESSWSTGSIQFITPTQPIKIDGPAK